MLSQNAWDMVLFNPLALFLLIIGFVFFFSCPGSSAMAAAKAIVG